MAAFTLLGIALEPELELPYALLRQSGGDLLCPILLGPLDAIELNAALSDPEGREDRQLIHVFGGAVRMLGAHVASVAITGYAGGLFTTAINLENGFGLVAIDARPADALAMAVISRAPILVAESVMAILAQAQRDALLAAKPAPDGRRRTPSSAEILRRLPGARPDMAGLVETGDATDEHGRRHRIYSGTIAGAGDAGEREDEYAGGDGGDDAEQSGIDELEPVTRRRM